VITKNRIETVQHSLEARAAVTNKILFQEVFDLGPQSMQVEDDN